MRAALACALACAGCGGGPSFVVVTVDSGAPVTLTALDFTLRNGGLAAQATVNHGASFTVPPARDVAFQIDAGRTGTVTVEVIAEGAALTAGGSVEIVPGGTARLTVQLAPASGDGPLSDGGTIDQARPDLAGCQSGCLGDTLHQCANDMASDVACPLGCSESGAPHCLQFVPGGGAVQPGDLTAALLGDVTIAAGAGPTVIDGDSGSITNLRGATPSGQIDGGVLYRSDASRVVFVFRSLVIAPGATVTVRGPRAVALVAQTTLDLGGLVDGTNGCKARRFMAGGSPGGLAGANGSGPGPGGAGLGMHNSCSGGGGGGYGGAGANGGTSMSGMGVVAGAGGGATPLDPAMLVGGSGGGGGGAGQSNGGNGGIAIQLVAGTRVTIEPQAAVNAGGCGGQDQGGASSVNSGGGGGGGSGGLILVEAPAVVVHGALAANGGGGGGGDWGTTTGGSDGLPSTVPAPGGPVKAPDSGPGGDGASLGHGAKNGGGGLNINNAGGGGGGPGYLVLHTLPGQLDVGGAAISPPAATGMIVLQ